MIQTPVVCPKMPLSRDLDVSISISRPLTEIATDMTLMCFLTPNFDVPPNNNRVRYYSTFAALQADTVVGSAMYFAGKAFFDRAVRPSTMAVGRVCENPVAAGLLAGDINYKLLSEITDGAFDLEINGSLVQVKDLDFSQVQDASDLPALVALLSGKMAGVVVKEKYGSLLIETSVSGDEATLDYAAEPIEGPTEGTDVSTLLGLTQENGAELWQGYTPQGLVAEADLVKLATRCTKRPAYGWTLDAKYRDTQEQKDFSDWVESFTAYFSACTNSVNAYNAGNKTNIGYHVWDKGYTRSSVIYHNNPQVYPDVSYIALALATNYAEDDAAITMKFKQLDGIEPSPLSESQLAVLVSRRINSYVYIGNNARTVREGTQGMDTWFTDTRVNLDNYQEELQVEVYNVFLRNKKVPYTSAGQDKLVSACAKINRRYTRNGVFAQRDVEAPELETGVTTLPATNIIPVPVAFATASERAARLAPPIRVEAYESGAFHKVNINVSVFA